MECKKLGDTITKKEYFVLFGEDDEAIAKVVIKVEKILTFYDNLVDDLS